MRMRLAVVICLMIAQTAAFPAQHISSQPPGIKDKIYNCTYPDTGLSLNVTGSVVDCGSVAGKKKTFLTKNIKIQQDVQVSLADAHPEALYAAFLLNPLSEKLGSVVSPILHTAAGNIPGSSLAKGEVSPSHVIAAFHPPNPPVPWVGFQYIYLVFLQPSEQLIDWDDVAKLGRTKFPIEKVASQKNLTLVASNYFSAEWQPLR